MGPIGLESLLEYFIFLSFLGGEPQPPRKESLPPMNFPTMKFQIPHFKILYTPMGWSIIVHNIDTFNHDILPGKIGGGGVKKRLYENGHGVVKTLWTVGQWFDIIIMSPSCSHVGMHGYMQHIFTFMLWRLQTICNLWFYTRIKLNSLIRGGGGGRPIFMNY